MESLSKLKVKHDFPYREPSDLADIRKERPKRPRRIAINLSERELLNKIYGGWLGRCAGCLLGKPVEGLSKEQIEKWLKAANAYPLDNYFPPLRNLPRGMDELLRSRVSRL